MPHKRRVTGKSHQTKLLFQPDHSFLYLEYYQESNETIHVPLHTFISVFVIKYIQAEDIKVRLYKTSPPRDNPFSVELKQSNLNYDLCDTLPEAVNRCRLPCWYLPSQLTCLAGLCSVVRYIVKLTSFAQQSTHELKENKCTELLGHMYSCLSAPAEVSTWTKFCEVELPDACQTFFSSDESVLPEELSKFEAHLNQPIRIHNVRKRMQDAQGKENDEPETNGHNETNENIKTNGQTETKKTIKTNDLQSYAKDNHIYAEGPDLLISDIILYPCVAAIVQAQDSCLRREFPLIARWYDRISRETRAFSIFEDLLCPLEDNRNFDEATAVKVTDESLYKCDPSRETPRICTTQLAAHKYFEWWEKSDLKNLQIYDQVEYGEENFDWNDLPMLIHPQAGNLPADRLERKCQQLEGLAAPIVHLAAKQREQEPVIVDFCSGGGHLGLLLAFLIPKATVHMVENKEESLARARERGSQLGLTNVWYYQSNIHYYQGSFSIGTSLHACGVATDIVIQKCVDQSADCVTCPCCYGAVQSIPGTIAYPRSQAYKQSGLAEEDCITMGHMADQTEKKSMKCEQGELFMDIVDTDRCLHLQEKGYVAELSKIYPLACSPKHNRIVATLCANNTEK